MGLEVLLVEDDIDLAKTIVLYCELEDIVCDHASNGASGLNLARENNYQVLLLDVNLPRMDGLTVCESLRGDGNDTPVLMLTARTALEDKLAGFQAGTDDYLVKPFDMEELIARIHALASRRSGQVQKLEVGDLSLDLKNKTVQRGEDLLKLSPTNLKMLETLMRSSPNVVSKRELEQAVWGEEPPDSNSLSVHIYNLRKAVDREGDEPLIQTVTGHGFALKHAPLE